jgi:hypothetical protein
VRIEPRRNAITRRNTVAREIQRARGLGPTPDPVCSAQCPDYQASTGCHRYCPAAPRRLSSDGDHSPVEQMIAPLVFELKKLGVFYPCWSCEGHNDPSGNLWKIPRIWFYADSVVHIRALVETIDRLFHAGRLAGRWTVVVTHSDPTNPDTTFSLEPEPGTDQSLSALQVDLRTMADEVGRHFWLACDALAARSR